MNLKITLACALLGLAACSKSNDSSSGSSGSRVLPEVTPLVREALADNLQPTALGFRPFANTSQAVEALSDFFTDTVGSISGNQKNGWIFAYLADVDLRTSEIQSSGSSEPSCLSATPIDTTFTAHTGHDLTLKLSCARAFGGSGDQSGTGSGLAYGRDENFYYMYLILLQQSNLNDKFGFAAKVNRSTNQVEMLFLESNDTYNRDKFFRLIAKPATNEIEFAVAGTSDGVGPLSTQTAHMLSPGTRLISNGTAIKAEGNVAATTNSSGAAVPAAFAFDPAECLNVTDLSQTTSCGSLTFTMPLVTAASLNGTTIGTSLKTITALITDGLQADTGSSN